MTTPSTPEHNQSCTNAELLSMRKLDDIQARLNRSVFGSDEPLVVALKGGWGEGKTHFWKHDVVKAYPDHPTGYVTLFGATSLQEIRERVVLAATPSFNLEISQYRNATTLLDRMKRWGNTVKGHLPEAISWLGLPENLTTHILEEELLKRGWILCLDDMERLSDSVEPKAFLGYLAELSDSRGLKVVLIYNHKQLEKKDPAFQDFQEKVIDKEIPFVPDMADILQLVFSKTPDIGKNPEVLVEVERCCHVLGLRNIRLLKKVKHYFDDILHELPDNPSSSFIRQALYSLILFVWIRFAKHDEHYPTFELLLDDSKFHSYLGDKVFEEESQEQNHAKARKLLSEYGYTYTDDLDRCLMEFIKTDAIDSQELLKEYDRYNNEHSRGLLESRFRDVWAKYYHNTLRDTQEQFCAALIEVTSEFMDFIPVHNLDGTLSMLNKLGKDSEAQNLLDKFSSKRADTIKYFDKRDLMEPIRYPRLKSMLDEAEKASVLDNRPIGDVVDSALKDDWPSSIDRERLAQFTSQDFVEYFTSNDQKHLTSKLRKLGTLATKITNPEEHEIHIQKTVRQAASEIAAQSPLNRLRMESMGLIREPVEGDQNHAPGE